jgi:hypothetical protein
VLDRQSAARDARARSPASVPVGEVFTDADLNSAYAALATRFPEESFSRALIDGPGDGKLQAGLVAALLAVIILMVAMNVA